MINVCFYIGQYPVRWTAQSALHFTPWQTCSFRHQLDVSGKHSGHAAIRREDYSLTFPPLYVARFSFIQLSELGCIERTEMPKLRNGSKGREHLNMSSLDGDSGILPLSYHGNHAPHGLEIYREYHPFMKSQYESH